MRRNVMSVGLLLGVLLAGGRAAVAAPIVVDSAVNPDNLHKYYLLSSATWTEAQAAAEALGGDLVTINDAAENEWIYERFGDVYLWIGLNDALEEGTFTWISGEPLVFTNWWPGEPNDSGSEDYVMMYPKPWGKGLWNDCGATCSPFGLVEVAPVPEPATMVLVGAGLLGACIRAHRRRRLPAQRLS